MTFHGTRKAVAESGTLPYDPNGNVKLIIEMRGQDGSKPAIIKQIIEISDSSFIMTKVVQYMTNGETVQRNQYRWKK